MSSRETKAWGSRSRLGANTKLVNIIPPKSPKFLPYRILRRVYFNTIGRVLVFVASTLGTVFSRLRIKVPIRTDKSTDHFKFDTTRTYTSLSSGHTSGGSGEEYEDRGRDAERGGGTLKTTGVLPENVRALTKQEERKHQSIHHDLQSARRIVREKLQSIESNIAATRVKEAPLHVDVIEGNGTEEESGADIKRKINPEIGPDVEREMTYTPLEEEGKVPVDLQGVKSEPEAEAEAEAEATAQSESVPGPLYSSEPEPLGMSQELIVGVPGGDDIRSVSTDYVPTIEKEVCTPEGKDGVRGVDMTENEAQSGGLLAAFGKTTSMDEIKALGLSGTTSYVITELMFWAIATPIVVAGYHTNTGAWLSLADPTERTQILAMSTGFVTAIRLAVPLRLGIAISLTPWVKMNITSKYLQKDGDSDGDLD